MASAEQYRVIRERNVMVPMRDGVRLATDIYRPDAPGRFPALVTRGPYGKDGYADNQGTLHLVSPAARLRGGQPGLPRPLRLGGRQLRPAVPGGPGRLRHRGVGRPPAVVQRPRRHNRPVLPWRHAIHPSRWAAPAAPGLHGSGVGVGGLPPELGLPHRRRYGVGPGWCPTPSTRGATPW